MVNAPESRAGVWQLGGQARASSALPPLEWSSDSDDSDFERPISKAARATVARGSASASAISLPQPKQRQQQQTHAVQAGSPLPGTLGKQLVSGVGAYAGAAASAAAAPLPGRSGGQAPDQPPLGLQGQHAQHSGPALLAQRPSAAYSYRAQGSGVAAGGPPVGRAAAAAAAAAADRPSQQGYKQISAAPMARGGGLAGARGGLGPVAQKANVRAEPPQQGQRSGLCNPGVPASKAKSRSSAAPPGPAAESGSDDEFVAGSLRQAPPVMPLPAPSGEASSVAKAAKASGKRKRVWKSQDGNAVADGWEGGADASDTQVTVIKLQPQGMASWPGWPRPVAPHAPQLPSQQGTPARVAADDWEMPSGAAGWGPVASGGPFQAVMLSPGWWEVGEGSDPLQCLSKVPLPELVPEGFVFVWVPKQLIHRACRLMNKWSYTLVENLTWVHLAPSASILRLPSPVVCASHLTLFIFRREGAGKDIELRHQRTPDVIVDCMAQAPGAPFAVGGSEGVPAEAFAAIETLLPTGKGKFLELWAPRGAQRPGWMHLVNPGATGVAPAAGRG